jgi:hypothetical protein
MNYESTAFVDSAVAPGVRFVIRKISFARRVELTRRIRDLAGQVECAGAGDSPKELLDAALLTSEIERTYVLWGLEAVSGLLLDGAPATPESLVSSGPEELVQEALAAVKAQCGLSEAERKN